MRLKAHFLNTFKNAKAFAAAFLYWLILGAVIGAVCGALGALFSKSVELATQLRADNGGLLYLLPIGGIISVGAYKVFKVLNVGTNEVFESVQTEKKVSAFLAPAIFLGSVITHLFGGSAGREGAALQLGGSVSSLLAKILRLDEKSRHILTMCGMGALFSAVFGTPLGACVFALEVVFVGRICSAAFFPALISSVTSYIVSLSLGTKPERFDLVSVPDLNFDVLWRVIVIAVVGALVSVLFCKAIHLSEKAFKKYFKNPFLRVAVGGGIIVLLTLALRTTDYNGGGIEVIERVFDKGVVRPEAFLLKIIFTAITVGAGYKGGEIVPALFVGATLGGVLAPMLALSPALGAAVGMAALFCGATNCPLATCFLCAEMFGANGMLIFAVSAITSFILSGYTSLYSGQKLIFSKLREEIIDENAT